MAWVGRPLGCATLCRVAAWKDGAMRITIAHKRTKAEVREKVDRTFNQMFEGTEGIPVQVVVEQKSWQRDVLSFALTAKMAFMSTPIKGTVEVTDSDVIIDADLGMLGKFVSEKAAGEMIGNKVKGLLN
jgi:Putative polyhydroxyalkanoic acid system protein (PHA_gran_rgn)